MVGRYDRSATIAGVKDAQKEGKGKDAEELVRRVLNGARDTMKSRVSNLQKTRLNLFPQR